MLQALVSQRVAGFRREIDAWSCDEEFRRAGGVHRVDGRIQMCPMRVRFGGEGCDKAMLSRQHVCGLMNDTTATMQQGVSPGAMWRDAPNGTRSFVLIMEESSPPPYIDDYGKIFWLVTNIPPSVSAIESAASAHEGKMPPLSLVLKNSFGLAGYTPPCPGFHETREYRLRLFAMPQAQTNLPSLTRLVRADTITEELQKTALCMSVSEVPFNFRRAAAVVEEGDLPSTPADMSGEVQAETEDDAVEAFPLLP